MVRRITTKKLVLWGGVAMFMGKAPILAHRASAEEYDGYQPVIKCHEGEHDVADSLRLAGGPKADREKR
jgi:hypothetical protein